MGLFKSFDSINFHFQRTKEEQVPLACSPVWVCICSNLLNKYQLRTSKLYLNQFTLTVNYTWTWILINLWQKFCVQCESRHWYITVLLYLFIRFICLASEGDDETLGLWWKCLNKLSNSGDWNEWISRIWNRWNKENAFYTEKCIDY